MNETVNMNNCMVQLKWNIDRLEPKTASTMDRKQGRLKQRKTIQATGKIGTLYVITISKYVHIAFI